MLTLLRGTVIAITRADAGAIEAQVQAENESGLRRVLAYPELTGPLAVGDIVVLNVTATQMHLGTGGLDFVVRNESRSLPETLGDPDGTEHIIKLRYTPLQQAIRACEMDPNWSAVWEEREGLEGAAVLVGGLHSQIAPAAAAVKAAYPEARVAYVMTDAAALPLALSRLVPDLKKAGLLDATLTAGQAFGGDYECVTLPAALVAARHIAGADVILVAQGPGNAGTGTRFGFSGIEQGWWLDVAGALGAKCVGVLRLSLADARGRHFGLSHHSVTSLGRIAQRQAEVALPLRPESVSEAEYESIRSALQESTIAVRHRMETADGAPGLALLEERGIRVTSMGRGVAADPLFFHAAAAAGVVAAERAKA